MTVNTKSAAWSMSDGLGQLAALKAKGLRATRTDKEKALSGSLAVVVGA